MSTRATLATPLGDVTVRWRGGRLAEIRFGELLRESTRRAPFPIEGQAPNGEGEALLAALRTYFGGKPPTYRVSIPEGTDFQKAVWRATVEIPFGETRTYGEIAEAVGHGPGSARAVGGAMGRNPIPPLIPCHRVVGADGGLTGFGYGVEWKAALLELEGYEGEALAPLRAPQQELW